MSRIYRKPRTGIACLLALVLSFLLSSCSAIIAPKGGTLVVLLPTTSPIVKSLVEVYYERYDLLEKDTLSGVKKMELTVGYDGIYWVIYKLGASGSGVWKVIKVEVSGGDLVEVTIPLY